MKRLDTFDGQDLGYPNHVDYLQDSKGDAIKDRIADLHAYGVVRGLPSAGAEFTLTFTAGNTQVNVGFGTSYDVNGERIKVDQNVAYQSTSTTVLGVPVNQNSGNQNIPLTAASLNYIWIDYLSIHDVTSNSQSIGELADLHFIKRLDGYRITVNTTGTPPLGAGVSILLGTMHTTTLVIDTSVRDIFGHRDTTIKIKPDTADQTTSYVSGTSTSLKEHINAIGSGAIGPNNPHGTAIDDLPVGTLPNSFSGPALITEIVDARGTQASIDARLDVLLENNGTLKETGIANFEIPQTKIDDDATEADTFDGLGGSSTLVNNLNRMRFKLKEILGLGSWTNTAPATLSEVSTARGTAGTLNARLNIEHNASGKHTKHWSFREIPSGSINGSNVSFSLLHIPVITDDDGRSSAHIYLDGLMKEEGAGNDYTINNTTGVITFTASSIPQSGMTLRVSYMYSQTSD